MAQLYELSLVYQNLIDQYNEASTQEELDSIVEQLLLVKGEFKTKAENFAKAIVDSQADVKKYSVEIDRLKGLESMAKTRAEKLKSALKLSMETLGEKNVKAGIFTIAIQNNGGNPAVTIPEELKDENGWLTPEAAKTLPADVKQFVPQVVIPAHYEPHIQGVVDMNKKVAEAQGLIADLEIKLDEKKISKKQFDSSIADIVKKYPIELPAGITAIRGTQLRIR